MMFENQMLTFIYQQGEKMKIITFQDIVNLQIDPSLCYEWAESMIHETF